LILLGILIGFVFQFKVYEDFFSIGRKTVRKKEQQKAVEEQTNCLSNEMESLFLEVDSIGKFIELWDFGDLNNEFGGLMLRNV
jgi:hypothetical protein